MQNSSRIAPTPSKSVSLAACDAAISKSGASDDPNLAPPPSKRRKQAGTSPAKSKHRNKNEGKLASLPDLPLDILYEVRIKLLVLLPAIRQSDVWRAPQILRRLDPRDLLHLSRLSKRLHTGIMSRTFAYVWRASIAGVKGPSPPPKPDDMNEPQYVDLLWGKGCHVRRSYMFEYT